jgi:hypothetical protein
MKNLKTKITITAVLCMLSIIINAQISVQKYNKINNVKLKRNQLKDLKLITGGNKGFAYAETANHGIGEKLANVELTFKSEKGGRIQKVKTNAYGNYKILLRPGRYLVTAKHPSYILFSSAPGFSVVNSKFITFNIPLQELLQYPIKKQPYNIIAVFNTKTKKLIDLVLLDKTNKRSIKKQPNTAMFYGTLSNSKSTVSRSNKKFSKGNTIVLYLNKKYIPGDQFLPGDMFISGDEFILNNTKFKVISKTPKLLKIVAL